MFEKIFIFNYNEKVHREISDEFNIKIIKKLDINTIGSNNIIIIINDNKNKDYSKIYEFLKSTKKMKIVVFTNIQEFLNNTNYIYYKNNDELKINLRIIKNNINKTFTILIPIYNSYDYLDKCINSVINQTFENYEIFLLDDHSNIEQYNKCNEKYLKNKNVFIIRNSKNLGKFLSINLVLNKIKSDYFLVLDSDDKLNKNRLLLDLLNFEKGNNEIFAVQSKYVRYDVYNKKVLEYDYGQNSISFKTNIIYKIGYYCPNRFGSDTEYLMRINKFIGKNAVARYNLVTYIAHLRKNGSNLTKIYNKQVRKIFIDKILKIYSNLNDPNNFLNKKLDYFVDLVKYDNMDILNIDEYKKLYLDLLNLSDEQVKKHWENNGRSEGRLPNVSKFKFTYPNFNAQLHLNKYCNKFPSNEYEVYGLVYLKNKSNYVEWLKKNNYMENTDEEMNLLESKQKLITKFENFISNHNIKCIHVSKALKHFKSRVCEKFGLRKYNRLCDKFENVVFFGLYDNEDYIKLTNHIGNKYLMWGGTDSNNSYNFRKEWVEKISYYLDIKNLAISDDIYKSLSDCGIEAERIYLNMVDTNIFKPVENLGSSIYIYNGFTKGNEEIYGKSVYEEVMKKLPEYKFILSNELNSEYNTMPKVYSECFIGLRLTTHDGNANTVQEFNAMGIPIIFNGEGGIGWNNADDIIEKIKSLSSEKKLYNNKLMVDKKSIDLEEGHNNSLTFDNLNNKFNQKKTYIYDDLNDLKINLEYDWDYEFMLNNNTRGDISNELNLIKNLLKQNCEIYVNQKPINDIFTENSFDLSIVRGKKAIKRENIPRPKFSFCVPYDDNCDGIYCITQSYVEAIQDKTSLLYPYVYEAEKFDEINSKPILLLEQQIDKSWYNWASEEEIKELRKKYYPDPNTFVICICGRIATNSYPKALLESIKMLRNQDHDVQLLVLGDLVISPYRLTKEEYDEITSYDWVKSFTVPKKEVLNYYRMCDVLASTYRDYCNVVGGCNKIKEFLLCDKPILCSRGKERERELGEQYMGFYECEDCYKIPPLSWTKEFLNHKKNKEYFKLTDKCNYDELKKIFSFIENIIYPNIHKKNYKNFKIAIYQENLAIRAYKLGISLYLKGYEIIFIYFKYSFDINYDDLNLCFFNFYKINNDDLSYNLFKDYLKKNVNDIIFINAWENFAVKSIFLNPVYYIGDLQILRHKLIKNGLENISVINEKKILNESERIIFTNKYMVNELIEKFDIKLKDNYKIIQNSLIFKENFEPKMRDYTKKNKFDLVYIGSVTLPDTKHHRNIINILNEIAFYNNNLTIHLYLTKFNVKQIKKINFNQNIKLHETVNQNFITSELSKYDYGLVIFNTNYEDSEYLNISQPNKFFDYYYSNLPIISINSKSFNDFINNNNLGTIINNYNLNNEIFQKKFFEKNRYVKQISYQKQLIDNYKPINLFPIKYLYTSNALNFFKKTFENKFELTSYDCEKNICDNVAFFGIYNSIDLNNLISHKGRKILIPGGSDINFFTIFKKNYEKIKNEKIKIFCQSKYLYNNCVSIYPKELTFLIPITPVIIKDFYEPHNIKGNSIYIYTCKNDIKATQIYGKKIYSNIINILSNKYSFIICNCETSNDVKNIYKKCFVGLRLTTVDGLGATNIELGLMGIKSITNNISPNCLSWTTEEDIIKHIENEAKNIGKSDPEMSNKVYQFIMNENIIIN